MSVHTSLSLALVGLGSWGQKIARTLNEEITSASLDFVVTSNENPHDFVLPYCQVFNSVNALLSSDVKVDGVILALPPHLNKAASLKIMAAGIPLFIEKPMAMSIADATEMLDFARARKAIVAVDHIDLHHSAITQLRRLQPGVPTHLEAKIGAAYNPQKIGRHFGSIPPTLLPQHWNFAANCLTPFPVGHSLSTLICHRMY